MQKFAFTALGMTVLSLAACKGSADTEAVNKRAATEQSASSVAHSTNDPDLRREQEWIKSHFAKTSCMHAIRQKSAAELPNQNFWRDSYSVTLSESSELMDHPTTETLIVRKSDHVAYLVQSGGLGESSVQFGPMDISSCIAV